MKVLSFETYSLQTKIFNFLMTLFQCFVSLISLLNGFTIAEILTTVIARSRVFKIVSKSSFIALLTPKRSIFWLIVMVYTLTISSNFQKASVSTVISPSIQILSSLIWLSFETVI